MMYQSYDPSLGMQKSVHSLSVLLSVCNIGRLILGFAKSTARGPAAQGLRPATAQQPGSL